MSETANGPHRPESRPAPEPQGGVWGTYVKKLNDLEAERDRLLMLSRELADANAEDRARIEELEADRDRYMTALERIEPVQQRTLSMLRREGFKFETPLHESEGWEKLAFTLYSTICETDATVRATLDSTEAPEVVPDT